MIFLCAAGLSVWNEQKKFHKENAGIAERIRMEIDAMLTNAELFTLQYANFVSLDPLISAGSSSNIRAYRELQDNLAMQTNHSLYQSIYVYFYRSDCVLTQSSYYERTEFFDRSVCDQVLLESKSIQYLYRTAPEERWGESNFVISVTRNFPLVSSIPSSTLIVNIDPQNLLNSAVKEMAMDQNVEILYEGKKVADTGIPEKSGDCFLYNSLSEVSLLEYRYAVSKSAFYRKLELGKFAAQYVLLLLGSSMLLFLFLRFYSRRYARLIVKMQSVLPFSVNLQTGASYGDLDTTVNRFVSENEKMEQMVREYTPIAQDQLLSNLLLGHTRWSPFVEKQIQYLQLSFPYPLFSCLLLDILAPEEEDAGQRYERQLYLKALTESKLSERISVCSVILSTERIAFLLNYPQETDLDSLLGEISAEITSRAAEENGIEFMFSPGSSGERKETIYHSYLTACMCASRCESGGNAGTCEPVRGTDYPHRVQHQVLLDVCNNSRESVSADVDAFFASFREPSPFSVLVSYSSVLLSTVAVELMENGIRFSAGFLDTSLRTVASSQGREELRDSLIGIFTEMGELSALSSPSDGGDQGKYAEQVVKFIHENCEQNISLGDIAASVHLNPKYLSRVFKRETGQSPLEYLNALRVAKSKVLLLKTSDSISSIAEELGYSDVRVFIRHFKKLENITPSQFRSAFGGKKESL